ncbi:MAG TPA: ion transporter [Oxalicibacterium sp.]|nr:ion transporter [Oxalicibacterium sp.]
MNIEQKRRRTYVPSLAYQESLKHLGKPPGGWREQVFIVIFEAETKAGRYFDFALIAAILMSVAVVMLDSIASVSARYGDILDVLEWFFTIAFTIEYIARLLCVNHPTRYARSFFGIVDLLSIAPTYAAFFIPGVYVLMDFRLLRLLRIFRLLKLTAYVEEYSQLTRAISASRRKIFIFLSVVAILVVLNGTLLYAVEGGPGTPFSSIPTSVYWAITTVSTVGFGDIYPQTDIGRAIASVTMLIGWGVLAVPTGIVTSEMTALRFGKRRITTRTCPECLTTGHEADANFCMHCGEPLPRSTELEQ